MLLIDSLKIRYPAALAREIGDSPEMANQPADLVIKGIKTASCSALVDFQAEESAAHIIRMISLWLVRFCDVTEAFARKEGEGDLSLEYWKTEHKAFFTPAGCYSEDMELVAEEYEVVEVL